MSWGSLQHLACGSRRASARVSVGAARETCSQAARDAARTPARVRAAAKEALRFAELSVRFLQAAHAAGRSAEHAKQSAQSGSAHVGEKAQGMGEARACGVGTLHRCSESDAYRRRRPSRRRLARRPSP